MSKPVDRMMQWPENRSEHAAASISGPVILMIGGGGSDCWITTATTRIWKKVTIALTLLPSLLFIIVITS